MAQLALKILNIHHASELARIVAAVGLVQNLGALRALATVGIIAGHMKLHISNLTLSAGATEAEVPYVEERLREVLSTYRRVSLQDAKAALMAVRNQAKSYSSDVSVSASAYELSDL
jgi:hydroxymethylglutaryl-CoA reductase